MKQTRFKKGIAAAVAVSAVLGAAVVSLAITFPSPPRHGVKYTPHNLGSTHIQGAVLHDVDILGNPAPKWAPAAGAKGEFYAQAGSAGGFETEICIFCHTPHNSAAGRSFLWNRTNSVTAFMLYTASRTLEWTAAQKSGMVLGAESRMCMTCHDGVTALNSMANPRGIQMQLGAGGDQIGDVYYEDFLNPVCNGEWCVNIGEGRPGIGGGGNLTNDHPVSFRYAWSTGDSTIKPLDGGGMSVGGLPLWADGKVECPTCHDPHINYSPNAGGDPGYTPFLRKKNSSSNLCFTCHNK